MMQRRVNKLTKKLLIDFEAKVKHRVIYRLRKQRIYRNRSHFIKNITKWKNFYKNRKKGNKKVSRLKPIKQIQQVKISDKKNIKKKTLKSVFFRSLYRYFTVFKQTTRQRTKLEALWVKGQMRRMKYILPKIFGRLRANFLIKRKIKRGYVTFHSLSFFSKIELLKKQHFFCFSTLSQIRRYIKRVEFCRYPNPLFLGLEGSFINLVFRTNLFVTTRQAYVFIRLGAFEVNKKILKKPHKILSVFDTFRVRPSFVKKIWAGFYKKVKWELNLFNIPNYIDFDYRLLTFFIWRLPTNLEKRIIYHFPFSAVFHNKVDFYPNQKNEFITAKDLLVHKIPRR